MDQLLTLALSHPHQAVVQARSWLAHAPTAADAAAAHQAIGIVLRDFGDTRRAVEQLRTALRWARRSGDGDRELDVRATLGLALVMAGRTAAGLATLDAVIDESVASDRSPVFVGRLLIRRVWSLTSVGRNDEALVDADRAVACLRGAGDPVWAARAYDNRGTVHFARGAVDRADRDYARSEELFALAGQRLEYADTRQERAAVAFARGDLPAALSLLDDSRRLVDELGVFEPELHTTTCSVLLAAGLARDASAEAEAAVARSERQGAAAVRHAELLTAAGRAAAATGDHALAARRAADALALFRRQRRDHWAARAELVLLDARAASGEDPGALLVGARRLAARLERAGSPASEAHLLAGQLAVGAGLRRAAEHHLRAAASARGRDLRGLVVRRLARATLAHLRGDSAAMLAECRRGLALVDVYQRSLGATELRAHATTHGSTIVDIALRHAVRRADPWLALGWSERRRATVLRAPPVRSAADPQLTADLAALRQVVRRLDDVPPHGHVPPALRAERRRLETAVRRRVLRSPAGGSTHVARQRRPGELARRLGDAALLELFELDDVLHAVVLRHGHAELVRVGPADHAGRALAQTLFALRQATGGIRRARHAAGPDGPPVDAQLGEIAHRLERHLLGEVVPLLGDADVVVVPTGRLHAVPWALLPSLQDREVSVAPSVDAWVRAGEVEPPEPRVVLVGGPRLMTGADEVRHLAASYPDALVLAEGEATTERVLAAIDGASLVHVAAHGTFRADSPLFSSLELDDGPLTVYDLERLGRAPHRVVLSSCNSAVGAPTGADEILGIVSALISLGAAGVLASVVLIDDPSTVPLMTDLHHHLNQGAGLPRAHLLTRRAARRDAARRVTADSFIALGH